MKHTYLIICLFAGLTFSCDRFLDTLPDNRTEVDTDEKIPTCSSQDTTSTPASSSPR